MAISRPVDVDELEKGVRQSIDTVHVRIPLPTLCECVGVSPTHWTCRCYCTEYHLL